MYCRKCDERVFKDKEDENGYLWPYFMQLCHACWPSKVVTKEEMARTVGITLEELELEVGADLAVDE